MKIGRGMLALLVLLVLLALLTGCAGSVREQETPEKPKVQQSQPEEAPKPEPTEATEATPEGAQAIETEDVPVTEEGEGTMEVIINGKTYTAVLDGGEAARELKDMLPLTLEMNELNGNEKYGDLPEALSQSTYSPGQIHAGDILLWGSDTLVVFYKDFSTQYSYTRIGVIENPEGLAEAVGCGNIKITFQ